MKRRPIRFGIAVGWSAFALWIWACQDSVSTEPNQVDFQVDAILTVMNRVEISRTDGQGHELEVLYDDSLPSLDRLKGIRMAGYQGGPAYFSIRGYLSGDLLVYDITITVQDGRASVRKNPGASAYAAILSLENESDLDGDGYRGRFTLRVDASTFYGQEKIGLNVDRRKGQGAGWVRVAASPVFTIHGISTSDARTFAIDGKGSRGAEEFRAQILDTLGNVLAQSTESVLTESPQEDSATGGYTYSLVNHTGAFWAVTFLAGGNSYLDTLEPTAPLNQAALRLAAKPVSIIVKGRNIGLYSVLGDPREIVYTDTVRPVATAESRQDTIALPAHYLVLSIQNNSATAGSRIVLNQGKADEWSGGYFLASGKKTNFGIFEKAEVATVHVYAADSSFWEYRNPSFLVDSAWGFSYMNLKMN